MPTPPAQPKPTFGLPLLAATLAVSVMSLGYGTRFLITRRRDAVALAQIQSGNLARSLEQSLSGTLQRIDLGLGMVVDELERDLAAGQLERARVERFKAAEERRLPEAVGIWVTDAKGRTLAGRRDPDKPVDYSDRAYFQKLRDQGGPGMVLSKAVLGHITRQWIIICAKRYNRPDGQFAGVVMMPVSIAYLQGLMAGYDVGPRGALLIRDADGDLVTRSTMDGRIPSQRIGSRMVSAEFLAHLQAGVFQASYSGRNPVDGVLRIYAFRRHPDLPLIALAGLAEDDYLGPWRQDRTWTLVTLGIFLAGFWGLTAILWKALRDHQRDTEALAMSEAKAHQLRKAESLGLMAGSIAHLFNNKLQAVMANLDLLTILPRTADPARHLAQARQATESAAEVSQRMLIYLGQDQGLQEPADLAELCRASLPHLQAALPPELVLEAELPSPGPVIRVNAETLRQVLGNLVTNAREALPDTGGSIRMALRSGPVPPLPGAHRFPIGWQPGTGAYACLEVADTGCGIAEADLDKLFDPFFSTKFTGRGLGLPVVLGIVTAHGGGVAVESAPGRGSSFRLFFPLAPHSLAPPPRRAAPSSWWMTTRRCSRRPPN